MKTLEKTVDFQEFLKQNRDKIIAITPKNPTIAKDDEWWDETEWDDLYNKLKVN